MQELSLFTGMLKEVFAGHPATRSIQLQHSMTDMLSDKLRGSLKTPTSSRHFKMAPIPVDSSELLRDQVVKAGLIPSQPWLEKVQQLHTLAQLKHGKQHCLFSMTTMGQHHFPMSVVIVLLAIFI